MIYVWIGVFIASLIVEILTDELVSIWFSLGSLASIIAYLCGGSVRLQIILFLVVSALLVVLLRRIFKKLLKNSKEKTNLDLLVGTTQKLTKEVSLEGFGEITVNGVVWRVLSKDKEVIKVGSKVKIVRVDGNKFIVEKEKK